MRLVIVADVFPPLRSSGAVQLRDLAFEFARQGNAITVIIATPGLYSPWILEEMEGVQVLRLRTSATRDVGSIRRGIGEMRMPFEMLWNLRKSPLKAVRWEAVVWYSPSIFLGPLVAYLKSKSQCRSYLIIRDIFPEWALDMGILRRGPVYKFFKAVARYQNSVADVIGVQSSGNEQYFKKWEKEKVGRKVEVLHNWLSDQPIKECSIQISQTALRGRKIFVYAGNMGVAQGIDVLLKFAGSMRHNSNVGFVFVGRGSEFDRIRKSIDEQGLDNVLLFGEIEPGEIPALYSQCDMGIVALDPRHNTHNIPGKFLSYILAGLPVLARVNQGNDLINIINQHNVGVVVPDNFEIKLNEVFDQAFNLMLDTKTKSRCRILGKTLFSTQSAVEQIKNYFSHPSNE